MGIRNWLEGNASLIFLCSIVLFSSCTDTLESEQVVYTNDFSTQDLRGFENARLFVFEGDTVSGHYHNEEVALNLDNLPPHNLLKVTLEILIHDTWDGNPDDGLGGPDLWYFGVDAQEVFRTSFSNSPCESTYCIHQSYPDTYFRQNRPKTGAIQTNMPGLCLYAEFDNYTTRYSISKIVAHSNPTARIYMNSALTANNSPDPLCDESWSLAKVTVEALTVN